MHEWPTWLALSRNALIVFAVASLAPAGLLARQSHPSQSPSANQAPATASISGQVIDADSDEPVAGAIVRIGLPLSFIAENGTLTSDLRTYTGTERYAQADARGRFSFSGMPAQSYNLVVMTPGYLTSGYGQQRPDGPWRQITLVADQHLAGLTLNAWKYAAITGTVFDEAGDPAVGASVNVLKYAAIGGRRALANDDVTLTDDRGVYRFWSLTPGEYIVVVPSATATLPTALVSARAAATQSGNTAFANAIKRDASAVGVSIAAVRLPVGDGFVLAPSLRTALPSPTSSAGGDRVYTTEFYPDADEPAPASTITVRSGEERGGVDFHLKIVAAFRVAGTVTGLDPSVGSVAVSLIPLTVRSVTVSRGYETAATMTAPDGRFLFAGVPEGQYRLEILKVAQPPASPVSVTTIQAGGQATGFASVSPTTPQAPAGETRWADTPLIVHGDIADVRVPLAHGGRISGVIEFQGNAPRPAAGSGGQLRVQLVAADGRSLAMLTPATPTADVHFTTMEYPPGRYYAWVAPVFSHIWFLKSFLVNGKDALGTPFDFSGQDLGNAVATFTDAETILSGSVTPATARASASASTDATVILFPADCQSWIAGGMTPHLYRSVASIDGRYRFDDLLPGEYVVVAVPANTPDDLHDPDVLTALSRVGVRVTLAAGDNRTVPLTIVSGRG